MSDFERTYHDDRPFEKDEKREKHLTIERANVILMQGDYSDTTYNFTQKSEIQDKKSPKKVKNAQNSGKKASKTAKKVHS